jgi:hypothetical protein
VHQKEPQANQNVRHKEVDMLKTTSIRDVRYLEADALRQAAALVSYGCDSFVNQLPVQVVFAGMVSKTTRRQDRLTAVN